MAWASSSGRRLFGDLAALVGVDAVEIGGRVGGGTGEVVTGQVQDHVAGVDRDDGVVGAAVARVVDVGAKLIVAGVADGVGVVVMIVGAGAGETVWAEV